MTTVHRFNAAAIPVAALGPMGIYDFARLYTNIPLDDLCRTIAKLTRACLEGFAGIEVLTTLPARHRPDARPVHSASLVAEGPSSTYSARGRHVRRFFDADAFDVVFSLLVSSTFIHFGPCLVRQICGIPMGISAAPFIANLFLGWYEFEFNAQRRQPDLLSSAHGSARILTRLYDKRDQPGFKALRLTRFIAADSNVNLPAKRALLAGQFQRLRRVITDPDNFAFEMARVVQALHSSGYARRNLHRTYGRLLQFTPHAFYYARCTTAFADLQGLTRADLANPAAYQPS
ncbi:hypothetical protein GPECTOR_5000g1268 [Gonium pectorale]|uniref:Uncharacterized protein n=1 Tax=Gonium pectorale TaxID=33097 RepID=A0A150H4Q2_GONPE|nr:hypothetical protein GPECTOR_5000g1268 [Gonium pectorale]|eukprot:KXZ57042.1 hypothetical protein GPECTOR_5000g1268 [Gonium pectorale]